MSTHERPSSRLERIVAFVDRLNVTSPWGVRIAAGVFVLGALVAVRSADVAWSELEPRWLVATALLSTPVILLNASEFRATAALVGARVALRRALHVAVVSTAANLLPLPGGMIMRAQSLRSTGVARRRTFAAQLGLAFVWLAEASLLSAVLLLNSDATAAVIFGLVGTAGALIGALVIKWLQPPMGMTRALIIAAGIELLFVASASIRIAAAIASLSLSPTLDQAVVLASATVLSAFVVILPAGLGVRELIAAGIAPLVGLSAATGFLIAAIVRVATMATFGTLALIVVRMGWAEDAAQESGVNPL